MNDPDYEPSIAPVAFSADWLRGFDSSCLHSTLMGTIPAPTAETDSEYCPFEYDDLPCEDENDSLIQDAHRCDTQQENRPPERRSTVDVGNNGLDDQDSEVSKALVFSAVKDLHIHSKEARKQFGRQRSWNNTMERRLKTIEQKMEQIIEQDAQDMQALEERLAGLEAAPNNSMVTQTEDDVDSQTKCRKRRRLGKGRQLSEASE
ncbi:hypothetical protein N7523_004877 [Penicillium sp. IBT 18751x]|nr:hypothetical protein N7523_004877 [Penicillium sp. IBT 18751x]